MATARHALRHRREQLDLSQEQAAFTIGVSVSAYRSWEAGTKTPRVGRRTRLAEVLGWTVGQLAVALDDESSLNGHVVPEWLGHLASLEQGASEIRAYEATTVHGLLQTPDYARAVESIGPSHVNPADVERKVNIRIARQAVLERRPDPLRLTVILDESVLLRRAGEPTVMAGQLAHLTEVAHRPNVCVQVLALDSAMFVFGSFALLSSPGVKGPYMAVTEDRAGPHYLDRPQEIEAHVALFDHLLNVALSPTASTDRILNAVKEYR